MKSLFLEGEGAGGKATASSIISDLFEIINKSQNYGFGIGIMADDLISGFFTMLIVWGLYICF